MKMAYHFRNGETITNNSFNGVDPTQTANQMFEALETLKRSNGTIKLIEDSNEEQMIRQGKDLVSVEFILE